MGQEIFQVDAFSAKPFAGNPAGVCVLPEEQTAAPETLFKAIGMEAQYVGKKELTAFQASARGGVVKVRVGDDRVYLGGKAVTVMRAVIL